MYSTTRYEGAINLSGLSGLDFSNIAISQIQMRVTFGPAGGDSTKRLTFYKATKNSISGSIATMRGSSIGYLTVSQAYDRTTTLTFNAGANAGMLIRCGITFRRATACLSFMFQARAVPTRAASATTISPLPP